MEDLARPSQIVLSTNRPCVASNRLLLSKVFLLPHPQECSALGPILLPCTAIKLTGSDSISQYVKIQFKAQQGSKISIQYMYVYVYKYLFYTHNIHIQYKYAPISEPCQFEIAIMSMEGIPHGRYVHHVHNTSRLVTCDHPVALGKKILVLHFWPHQLWGISEVIPKCNCYCQVLPNYIKSCHLV